MWIAAPVVVLIGSVVVLLVYRQVRGVAVPVEVPGGRPRVDSLEVIKTTLTMLAFVGAVLTGLYAYRKQRLAEGDAARADAQQFADRYTKAADQLGSDKAAVRLAGVYAMARLADDWREQRQTCIDVLCAYLRMPYQPPGDPEHRPGEDQVRTTIVRVIVAHLREDAITSWAQADFDFTGAHFESPDFDATQFCGDARFDGATFSGVAWFGGVKFSRPAWFDRTTFSAVSFHGARFSGPAKFAAATFSAAAMFDGATFSSEASFKDGTFSQAAIFRDVTFSDRTSFHDATFSGPTDFERSMFCGPTSFLDATFSSIPMFDAATFYEPPPDIARTNGANHLSG